LDVKKWQAFVDSKIMHDFSHKRLKTVIKPPKIDKKFSIFHSTVEQTAKPTELIPHKNHQQHTRKEKKKIFLMKKNFHHAINAVSFINV